MSKCFLLSINGTYKVDVPDLKEQLKAQNKVEELKKNQNQEAGLALVTGFKLSYLNNEGIPTVTDPMDFVVASSVLTEKIEEEFKKEPA